VKYSLSDKMIWLTMNVSFRFIHLKNGYHYVIGMTLLPSFS
jgi:hypothetical protein